MRNVFIPLKQVIETVDINPWQYRKEAAPRATTQPSGTLCLSHPCCQGVQEAPTALPWDAKFPVLLGSGFFPTMSAGQGLLLLQPTAQLGDTGAVTSITRH